MCLNSYENSFVYRGIGYALNTFRIVHLEFHSNRKKYISYKIPITCFVKNKTMYTHITPVKHVSYYKYCHLPHLPMQTFGHKFGYLLKNDKIRISSQSKYESTITKE